MVNLVLEESKRVNIEDKSRQGVRGEIGQATGMAADE